MALSGDELISIQSLLVTRIEREWSAVERGHSSYRQTLKRARLSISGHSFSYVPLEFFVLTSNVVERMFSKAGLAHGDRRKSPHPANFESQFFLHLNVDLWGSLDLTILQSNKASE